MSKEKYFHRVPGNSRGVIRFLQHGLDKVRRVAERKPELCFDSEPTEQHVTIFTDPQENGFEDGIQHDVWLEQVRRTNEIYNQSISVTEDPRLKGDQEVNKIKVIDLNLIYLKELLKIYGRNDPCPCFSGKKFKKCCLLKLELVYAECLIEVEDFEELAKPFTDNMVLYRDQKDWKKLDEAINLYEQFLTKYDPNRRTSTSTLSTNTKGVD